MKRWLLWLGLLLLIGVLALALVPMAPTVTNVELTRYLWGTPSKAANAFDSGGSFKADPGEATLRVARSCDSVAPLITLNGSVVELPSGQASSVPVSLLATNTIDVVYDGATSSTVHNCLSFRLSQVVEITTHVLSRVHFNTNVSSFERAREFYGALGFETLSGFPDTNTQAMARAIGIATPTAYDGSQGDHAGGYLLHGELVGPKGFSGGVIDLIEFTVPRDEQPPYARLNHLGMARAVMITSDVDADFAYLSKRQVSFVSAPVSREDGSRFAVFRDLDGTSYELRQLPATGEEDSTDDGGAPTHITRLGAVGINVSDYERSRAWYQMLGFDVSSALPESESLAVANAMGFDQPWRIKGSVVSHAKDRSQLELIQWQSPVNLEPPYPLPVNHLGMHRMAFSTSDIESDVAMLRSQGVEFVSPITPCCSGDDSWGAIVAFLDPDGTVLELVEQPLMTPLLNVTMRLAALTGN